MTEEAGMRRVLGFIYGVIAYAGFMAWMVYMIGFLGYFAVLKSVDSGSVGPVGTAIFVNFLMIFIFGPTHHNGPSGFQAMVDAVHPEVS